MGVWRELRTRWMYWRFRNITRNRQRLAARWATRRSRGRAQQTTSYRGIRPAAGTGAGRTARTWILLILAVVGMAVVQHYSTSSDLTFVLDIAILTAAYVLWTQVAYR